MTYYKSYRIIDGKPRWVIVDEAGNIINRNPSKEELKYLNSENKDGRSNPRPFLRYKKEALLECLIRFYRENGRIPVIADFTNNSEYPSYVTYYNSFGSWINALKLAGLDVDLMGRQGSSYKARLSEIKVRDHFKQHPIDLAGENRNSPCDGICPNGKTYDVKSSTLAKDRERYHFNTNNKYKEHIEIYYLLALNDDGTIKHAWRIGGELVEKDFFHVGLNSNYEFNIENMKEYDITNKFKDIIKL